MTQPVAFYWSGQAMLPRAPAHAQKEFAVGETYMLTEVSERSSTSHKHYFASVTEAWRNLPEDLAAKFPTPEHLRKWALMKVGFFDERSIVCASPEEAQKVAAFVKPMDDYAVVVVREDAVKVYTAQSQSTKAMDGKTFQESKQKVLDFVADLIGVSTETLADNAARAE